MSVQRIKRRRLPADAEFSKRIAGDRVLRVLFEVMFDQENRLRTLESRPAVTRTQALAALRAKFEAGG